MYYLLITSFIWGFSFVIIKSTLSNLDASFVAFVRMFLSFLVFLPLLRLNILSNSNNLKLIALGAIQHGLMYIFYIYSFKLLSAHEVAMFTIFTPFYVILLDSFFAKKFRTFAWIAVLCTVLGSAVISYSSNFEIVGENIRSRDFLLGFWLLQISNLCFAIGQFFYAKMFLRSDDKIFPSETTKKINHTKIFALLYLGGSIITFIVASFSTSIIDSFCILSKAQIFSLLYLGIIASGLGFFLWNVGATKVGTTLLAIFNNLKIPLAVLAALIFLPEKINFIRFVVGSALIIISLLLSVKSDKIARR